MNAMEETHINSPTVDLTAEHRDGDELSNRRRRGVGWSCCDAISEEQMQDSFIGPFDGVSEGECLG